MKIFVYGFVIILWISLSSGHTHDEIPKCALTGVYKTRQTILESPNYPSNYTPDTCWDYVIRSPYRCPTKFHIQFLDFYLEASKDCENDYLAIGLDNVDDDMDVLCGQVVGIKKYHTPDGVLRLRFFADESPWSTGKGFKLLVTRLACEKEEVVRKLQDDDDDDDTVSVTASAGRRQPPQTQIKELLRNLTGTEQYQVYPLPPLFGLNYPTQLPSPPYPAFGGFYLPSGQVATQQNYIGSTPTNGEKPCKDETSQKQQQQAYYPSFVANNNNNYLPVSQDQYVGAWPATSYLRAIDGIGSTLEACCTSAFQQKRFYLSSPGFPRTIFSNILPINRRDCEFHLQKYSANVCRLRVEFKFFDFGQSFQGTGSFAGNVGSPAIISSQNTCTDDYIEIDNQRFCGCRSEYVHTAFWNYQGDKKIRMRMGYSGVPTGGFLLEIVQELCSETQFSTSTIRPAGPLTPTTAFPLQDQNALFGNYQSSQGYLPQQAGLLQQAGLSQQNYGGQLQNFGQSTLQQTNYPGQQPLQQIFNGQGFSQSLQQNPLLQQQFPIQGNGVYQPLPQFNMGSAYPGYQYNSPNPLQTSPFGIPQLRYARSYTDSQYQQPVTIVETNSTRKEIYFSDNDNDAYNENPNLSIAMSRSSKADGTASRWEAEDGRANDNVAKVRRKCTFDMRDILRLSVDVMWITKPTCYAPQRNWFTNILGFQG